MITQLSGLSIFDLFERKNDLLVSVEDIKEIARNERNKTVDEMISKMNDTSVKISIDLPVEEILGEDIDLDDFSSLMQDAIMAYRKMVIGSLEDLKKYL